MIEKPSYLCGQSVVGASAFDVRSPWSNEVVGRVSKISGQQLEQAITQHLSAKVRMSRYQRYTVLNRTQQILNEQRESLAELITAESGLCLRETRYEVGRACDVFTFSAMEALRDDGETFACDISPNGKERKIFTLREPLPLVAAITPFNHPLNQVAHKLAPAIAAGTKVILKPSEKTPLTAIRLTEILYEAGLPGEMLSCVHGDLDEVTRRLVVHPQVSLVTFTGSAAVGKEIASKAGYKKVCLELGGHSPLLILRDADLDLAARLACEGCFRNSGQRCTAVRRILVDQSVEGEFLDRFVALAREYRCGDPTAEETRVGTVIDEAAAIGLESAFQQAISAGAKVLLGGKRSGALLEPTILTQVPRTATIATQECFGPLAPVYAVDGLEDAIQFANATDYGLSSGVVTNNMDWALRAIKEIHAGTVNINEIPGYRLEWSPFGGIKDSGLGVKEGVIEAIKFMTTVKTYSLPW